MVNKYDGKWLLKYQLYSVAEKDILFTKEYDYYNPKNLNDLVGIVKREVPSALSEKLLGIKTEIKEPVKTSFWVAIGLDVLGAAAIYAGYLQNGKMNEALDKYNQPSQTHEYYKAARKDAESSQSSRNTFYVIGGVFLASSIGVHIWF